MSSDWLSLPGGARRRLQHSIRAPQMLRLQHCQRQPLSYAQQNCLPFDTVCPTATTRPLPSSSQCRVCLFSTTSETKIEKRHCPHPCMRRISCWYKCDALSPHHDWSSPRPYLNSTVHLSRSSKVQSTRDDVFARLPPGRRRPLGRREARPPTVGDGRQHAGHAALLRSQHPHGGWVVAANGTRGGRRLCSLLGDCVGPGYVRGEE